MSVPRWSPSLAADGRVPTVQLSRHALLQSAALIGFAGALVAMIVLAAWLPQLDEKVLRGAALSIMCLAAAGVIALLPSSATRAWAKVVLAKHLFAHRYDYREEWLRFTGTLAHAGEDAPPLAVRAAKAIADITGSPAALLLTAADDATLVPDGAWGWTAAPPPLRAADAGFSTHLRDSGRVIALDGLRDGRSPEETALVPRWMLVDASLWAVVPLLHLDRLEGALLLARPRFDRRLDWEDFDLLKIAGRQVASWLAEARGQEALSDARRFDEFNRRFAFVMHDIKNLVSQLALVARNAERHADNPAFRVDMIDTLNGSAERMNDLLARLSQHHRPRGDEPRAMSLGRAACAAAEHKRGLHPIRVDADPCLAAFGDPNRLDQALAHLIQNAIEASEADAPVTISTERRGDHAAVTVADRGHGMDAEFVAKRLFRPFASTKTGGFGIGAYEVRDLVRGMGGRLEVESRPGEGTRFTILLPIADFPAVERRGVVRETASHKRAANG